MADARVGNDDPLPGGPRRGVGFIFLVSAPFMLMIVAANATIVWFDYQGTKRQVDAEQAEQVESWVAQHPELREPVQKRLESDCKDQAAPCLSHQEFNEIRDRYQPLRKAQAYDQIQKVTSEPSPKRADLQDQQASKQ